MKKQIVGFFQIARSNTRFPDNLAGWHWTAWPVADNNLGDIRELCPYVKILLTLFVVLFVNNRWKYFVFNMNNLVTSMMKMKCVLINVYYMCGQVILWLISSS